MASTANTELYQKMQAELERFKDWLCTLPAQEILNHAYEYTTKEDILLAFENFDLLDHHAKALLSTPAPLDEIYHSYEKNETDFMETLQNCMGSRADAILSEQRNTPIYLQSAAYALKHEEADAYRVSHQANVACRYAIEEAINNHYRDNRLDVSCAKDIVAAFGMERVQTVLASTIQAVDWDGRISDANKAWAKSYPIPDEVGREYHVNGCHRGLTDLFCTEVRKIQREMEKKPSVLGKLSEAIPTPHKPSTSKSKGQER